MEKVRVTKVNVVKDEKSDSKKAKGRAKKNKKFVDESIEQVEVTKLTLDAPVAKEIGNEVIDEAEADIDSFVDSEDTLNNSSVNDQIGVPKKVKKIRKHKPVGRAGFIAICTSMSILGAALGCVSGYFLYNHFKPEEVYEATFSDFDSLLERAEKNPNLIEEFKDDKYNIINLAFDKYTKHKNTLTLGYGEVDSMNGMQYVHAATLGGGDKAFNQNVSYVNNGKFQDVHTAFRFYYDTANKEAPVIHAFEKKVPADWKNDPTETNTYDADKFISKYGKLNYGSYVVDEKDKFVSLDNSKEGKIINAVSIYQFTEKSVLPDCKYKKLDAGHEFEFTLKCKLSCKYYATQIKTNGGLGKNPKFADTLNIKFQLNENYELVSSFVTENYEVTAYGVTTGCKSTMSQKYYFNDEENFVVEGANISIPKMNEDFAIELQKDGSVKATASK